MAIDPLRRIVSPRFWAGAISSPLLSLMFCVLSASLVASWLALTGWERMKAVFGHRCRLLSDWQEDIVQGSSKLVAFGAVVTWAGTI